MLSIYIKKKFFKINKNLNNYSGITNLELLEKSNIRCPDFQRLLDPKIIEEIEEEHKNNSYNTILLEIGYLNDEYYLLDGQHRYQAIKKMNNKKYELTIHLHKLDTYEELKKLFFLINKNTIIPDDWIFIDNHTNIKIHLKEIFGLKIFNQTLKNTKKPFKPNISKQKLNDLIVELYKENFKITSKHIFLLNEYYKNLNPENFPCTSGKSNEEYLEICKKKYQCFIGMVIQNRDNYDILIDDLKKIYNKEDIEIKTYNNIKKKIPSNVRENVWKKYLIETNQITNEIKCPISFCNKMIDSFNFECGHIISDYNKGKISLDNLRPICSSCNKSMGRQNWDDFENRFI